MIYCINDKEKELIKEYPTFNNNLNAINDLSQFLTEKGIKFKRDEEIFKIIVLEEKTKDLSNLIKLKIKEIKEKYCLYSYSEGLNNFTFGF